MLQSYGKVANVQIPGICFAGALIVRVITSINPGGTNSFTTVIQNISVNVPHCG